MQLKTVFWVLGLSSGLLTGCQSLPVQVSSPVRSTTVAESTSATISLADVGSTTAAESTFATISLADFREELGKIPTDAKATRLADQLTRFDLVRFEESQRAEATQMIDQLAKRLRSSVQKETKALHVDALKAPDYKEGSKKAREAGAIIALYPLSEDQKSLEEAESLAQTQGTVITQLKVIQRKRYNQWAIDELKKAQSLIDNFPYPTTDILDRDGKKKRWKDAQSKATSIVKFIEPSFLEPAVAPFYQELLSQLGGKEKDYRNDLLKQIVDPSVQRKILDDY